MKLGIMQPYFLPYVGYWQLLNEVDSYVVYDDVNYIKGGWINRNRILVNGKVNYLTLELQGASPNKLINEIGLSSNNKSRIKLVKTISQAYKKAPMYDKVFPLIEEILLFKNNNLGTFVFNSIDAIAKYLDIDTKLYLSSEISKDNSLKGQDKVINICKQLNADTYINAIGGQKLYSFSDFRSEGIVLRFLKTCEDICYPQLTSDFCPSLSILDMLMMLPAEDVKLNLKKFTLIDGDENA